MEDRLHSFIFSLFIVNLAISYKKKAATLSSKDHLLTKFAKLKKKHQEYLLCTFLRENLPKPYWNKVFDQMVSENKKGLAA